MPVAGGHWARGALPAVSGERDPRGASSGAHEGGAGGARGEEDGTQENLSGESQGANF